MKNLLIILCLFFSIFTTSHGAIGDNVIKSPKDIQLNATGSVKVNGKLDVVSTTKASKPYPSMTTAQRDAISSPQSGDMIFNADTNMLNIYVNSAWGEVAGSGTLEGVGTENTITKWGAEGVIQDSQIADNGTTASISNNLTVGKTLKAASEYVTGKNKIDGSFESAVSPFVVIPTATIELDLNYHKQGLKSLKVTSQGSFDTFIPYVPTAQEMGQYYIFKAWVYVAAADAGKISYCRIPNGVTANADCKVINKTGWVKVEYQFTVTNATESFGFKSSAASLIYYVDDVFIGDYEIANVTTVKKETYKASYTSTISATSPAYVINFATDVKSSLGEILSYDSTTGFFSCLKKTTVAIGGNVAYTSANSIAVWGEDGTIIASFSEGGAAAGGYYRSFPNGSFEITAGKKFRFGSSSAFGTFTGSHISITATSTQDNVIQASEVPEELGELKFLPQNKAPTGFIPALGSSIGNTLGTYQGNTYKALYNLLWTMASATAGEPYVISSAKGATADADWTANKTITIDVSGLVVRAYKSGVSGVVGAKQMDAVQEHTHNFSVGGTVNSNWTSAMRADVVGATSTTGVQGARSSTETRMTNIAQYAFIRYSETGTRLFALPTATQQDYYIEASGNAGQTITANVTDIPFILSSQKNLSWDGSGFTAPIDGVYDVSGSIALSANAAGRVVALFVNGVTANKNIGYMQQSESLVSFSVKIKLSANQRVSLRCNTTSTLTNSASWHWISITRLNGKNDSVYVGNVSPIKVATLEADAATVASVAGGYVDLTYNRVLGNTSFITWTSGAEFTLEAGEYEIESEGQAYQTNNAYHLLSKSDNTPISYGTSVHSNVTADSTMRVTGRFEVLVVSQQSTFKVRQYAQVLSAVGFGNSARPAKRAKVTIRQLVKY